MSASNDVKEQVLTMFKTHDIEVKAGHMDVFDAFIRNKDNALTIDSIIKNQAALMDKWKLQERIAQIRDKPIRILNASVGKSYEARFDFEQFGWQDIIDFQFEGLEEAGLTFNKKQRQISGNPAASGDINIIFKFRIEGQPDTDPYNEKVIPLIINPDPRSLWKSIESDRNDPFWKENDVTLFSPLGEKHLLVSSKRGRAHANVGSFREDDFAFRELKNGWCIVVVSDGAGSAKLSRKGSEIACNGIVAHFEEESALAEMLPLDELLSQYAASSSPEIEKKLNLLVYNNLGNAALKVHKKLEAFSIQEGITLKDLSCTLIFTLFRKFERGYAFLSFGVGDCPIAVLNEKITEVTLLNWIDVGDFGGGTRFITMPEIFHNEKFATRFNFKLLEDFSYLFLMSDGIYDPKFVVESNLSDIKKWKEFLADLGGRNEERVKVNLTDDNQEIINQLSEWMDFWSTGNHDDRTLAIIF